MKNIRLAILPSVSIRSLNAHCDPFVSVSATTVEELVKKIRPMNNDIDEGKSLEQLVAENHSGNGPLDPVKIAGLGERGEAFLARRAHAERMNRHFEKHNPSTRPDPAIVKEFANQRNHRPQI